MTLGSLFAGIGGFELGAIWAGITPVWSNEIDSECCERLRNNFTHEIIEEDIRDCGKARKYELPPVDIISGGFPCQPFSHAGKRQGQDDDRYLWPEMLRIIKEVRPTWVIGENVAGILSMAEPIREPKVESRIITRTPETDYYEAILTLEEKMLLRSICKDLEEEGYEVQSFVVPACAAGAPHRRDRIWIVAYAGHGEQGRRTGEVQAENGQVRVQQQQPVDEPCKSGEILGSDVTNAECGGSQNGWTKNNTRMEGGEKERKKAESHLSAFAESNSINGIASDPEHLQRNGNMAGNGRRRESANENRIIRNSNKPGLQGHGKYGEYSDQWDFKQTDWQEHWLEAATRFCGMDDGLPDWLDGRDRKAIYNAVGYFGREEVEKIIGIDCQKVEWQVQRVARLKMLGNAIVPYLACEFFKAIKIANDAMDAI